ncbi:MAG TPA: hypothetical protein VKR23_13640 [Gaiellaceae bacterium]|nr:hypothetical protein [Gaiellaceae bacterium]
MFLLAAGCGGSSRLSPNQYRVRLGMVARQADQAQSQVEEASSAKTVIEIQTRLRRFATAEQQLGDEVATLKPPTNAERANGELARGEHDTASEVRALLPQVGRLKSVKATMALLDRALGNANGAREIDHALAELKQAGYTKGS